MLDMVLRRHKGLLQAVFLLVVVGGTLRFAYNYYKENALKLKAANIRHHELLEERNKIKRELESLMESKNNLEYSLRTKVGQFKKLKEGWDLEKRDFENHANRDKENFRSLDSEYRMLKATRDDLQIDYDHMKKNFDRMRKDHSKLDTEYKKNYAELKQKDEKIISALQRQVEHYQKQENSLQVKVQDLEDNVLQYQKVVAKLQQEIKLAKAKRITTETKNDEPAQDAVDEGKKGSRLIRRRKTASMKGAMKSRQKGVENLVRDGDRELKHKQFLKNLEMLAKKRENARQNTKKEINANKRAGVQESESEVDAIKRDNDQGTEGKVKAKKIEDIQETDGEINRDNGNGVAPNAGHYTVDANRENTEGKRQQAGNDAAEKKDDSDKIEVISENGKDETNLKLDEQKGNEAGVRHALAVEHKEQESLEREKREAAEPLNNDQKFDDQDAALQEAEENEDNMGDENEQNDMIEQPENLLMKNEQETRDDREEMQN